MRLIQISVPEDQRAAIVDILRDQQIGYSVVDGAGDQADRVVINFVVPADAVEHILADLETVGFDRTMYTVSLETEFANYKEVDAVQNRWGKTPNRLAPDALRSKAKDLRLNTPSFVWMMVLSAIVATAGLLLSSPAVVVGSMVIAPIVSPVLTAGVGAVRNDRMMLIESIHLQTLGLGVAILSATLFAWTVKTFAIVPVTLDIMEMELISLRVSPSILAIAVGLAAGAAGSFGLATKGNVSIVGVMIAAALIPTAAAVGVGIAWGHITIALGALLLLIISMIGVNVGAGAMLFYLDYRPDHIDQGILAIDTLREGMVVAVTLIFVVGTVVLAGGLFLHQSGFERTVNDAVTDVLRQDEYREIRVVAITMEYRAPVVSDDTIVSVTLSRPENQEFVGLPPTLARVISERTNHDVDVRVRFITYHDSPSQ